MKSRYLPAAVLWVLPLWSHPMGNFSVSHYAALEVERGGARIVYALDLAEIPTFELFQQWGIDAGAPPAEVERRAKLQARQWVRGLRLEANGRAVAPHLERAEAAVVPGAGGMPVLRVVCELRLAVADGALAYEDRNYVERPGWKEIVIRAGAGASLMRASHGDADRSRVLTEYPADPTVVPPQDTRATLEWRAAPAAVISRAPAAQAAPAVEHAAMAAVPVMGTAPPAAPSGSAGAGTVVRGDFLSRLLRRGDLGVGLVLVGLAVAFGLGAMHALSPGHGKTIVAAYLVGSRGTVRHALFLGGMVTFTHTISVFLLGLTTLFLSRYVLPQQLFPVLGAISGLSIVWIGGLLLYRRARALRGPSHAHHQHHHDHHHHDHHPGPSHDHDHEHGPHTHTHVPEGDVTMGSLIALGASGGLVPCPSALVLLLSSVALGRVGLGLLLLVGFSAGLAAVLMGIGLVVLYAKHLLPDSKKAAASPAFRLIPVLSAAVILCLGLLMTGVSLGVIQPGRIIG